MRLILLLLYYSDHYALYIAIYSYIRTISNQIIEETTHSYRHPHPHSTKKKKTKVKEDNDSYYTFVLQLGL